MRRSLSVALLLLLAAMNVAAQEVPRIESLASPVTVRLRGLSAVGANIAWASGREGTVLRTTDAGKTWSVFKVPGAEKLDFRDVEGFSADEAVILSIGPGEDSRVYRTDDGGRSWQLTLQNHDPKAFFDCFDFDGREGRLLGDPVGGRFQLLGTTDGGKSWSELQGPEALEGEAAFAASGTCVLHRDGWTTIATGGAAVRLIAIADDPTSADSWYDVEIAKPSGPSAGAFSMARFDLEVLVVGGDYNDPFIGLQAGVVVTHSWNSGLDGVETHETLVQNGVDFPAGVSGYRSGIACRQATCIATGPTGSDVFVSGNGHRERAWWEVDANPGNWARDHLLPLDWWRRWERLSADGYDSVDVADGVFWFSGDGGRLGRLVLPVQ